MSQKLTINFDDDHSVALKRLCADKQMSYRQVMRQALTLYQTVYNNEKAGLELAYVRDGQIVPKNSLHGPLAQVPLPPRRARTPAATWRETLEEDPHGERYNCERAELAMGDLTDDELANGVFRYGNVRPSVEDLIAGTAHSPLAWLTAAKDRIRWLSRLVIKLQVELRDAHAELKGR